jgi:hypothetical protein
MRLWKIIISIIIVLLMLSLSLVVATDSNIDVTLTADFGDCMSYSDFVWHYNRWKADSSQFQEFHGWYESWRNDFLC